MRIAGKTCVITGATSGIGRATTIALGRMGGNLVLLGRNESAGQMLAGAIQRFPSHGRVEFIRTDLSDLKQVREAVRRIAEHHKSLDVLINNAGARFDAYRRSADGFELTFATNHLGHYLLTLLLLDLLKQSPDGRVVTITSRCHNSAKADGQWQMDSTHYDRHCAYAKSKLANLLFAYELSRRLVGSSVTSNAVDPGVVGSQFARNNGWWPWMKHILSHGVKGDLVTSSHAARTVVFAATADAVRGNTGKLFFDMQTITSSEESYNQGAAIRLWELSGQLTGLADQAGLVCSEARLARRQRAA